MQQRVLAGLIAGLCATATTGVHAQQPTLQDFINDHHQLERQAQWCQMQFQQYSHQAQYNAYRGGMTFVQPPACMNDAPRITARMAYDETQIRRIQNNGQANYCDTGVCGTLNYQQQYVPQGRRDAQQAQTDYNRMLNGYELTDRGNERQVGPNGRRHFDCGPGMRDVTAQSFAPYPDCVPR